MGMLVAVLRECKHLTYYVVHEVVHVLKLKFVNIKFTRACPRQRLTGQHVPDRFCHILGGLGASILSIPDIPVIMEHDLPKGSGKARCVSG